MELFLLKNFKISRKNATRSFWRLPAPDSFSIYFILFYIENFLSLQLSTYTYRVSVKYGPKPKNFMVVDSEILSMKNEMSQFAPVTRHLVVDYLQLQHRCVDFGSIAFLGETHVKAM